MQLDPKTTALVLIDLQKAVVARSLAPYTSQEVVQRSADLAAAVRDEGGTVVYVHVDLADMVRPPADESMSGTPSPDASELVPEAGLKSGDLVITKRYWGAFIGTDLEFQLKARGIETIVLAGIATNFGVESTAREAAALGFSLVLVEDACSSMDEAMHRFAFDKVFPRLSRVRSTREVLQALG
ncbi:MAG TPA: hydrolase [Fimbriimonas sp.]|nr:hydrolase [Fimbriimonas sp.]